jgi:hypothetical protein
VENSNPEGNKMSGISMTEVTDTRQTLLLSGDKVTVLQLMELGEQKWKRYPPPSPFLNSLHIYISFNIAIDLRPLGLAFQNPP